MNHKLAINMNLSTIESKMQNKQISRTEKTNRYREHFDSCQMGGRLRQVKKMKGLRSTNWLLQNSHGDVKYSIGNIVSNIVITIYGVRWV